MPSWLIWRENKLVIDAAVAVSSIIK
jgi:hypothetical protein